MYVKKFTSFRQVLKKMNTTENWFLFSASRCTETASQQSSSRMNQQCVNCIGTFVTYSNVDWQVVETSAVIDTDCQLVRVYTARYRLSNSAVCIQSRHR